MRDADELNPEYNLCLTTELVESRMTELSSMIDKFIVTMLLDSQ